MYPTICLFTGGVFKDFNFGSLSNTIWYSFYFQALLSHFPHLRQYEHTQNISGKFMKFCKKKGKEREKKRSNNPRLHI